MDKTKDEPPLLDEHADEPEQLPQKSHSDVSDGEQTTEETDVRFNPPPPSPWKRSALIILVCFLFYFGFRMRASVLGDKKPKVIYASRYSKEHKFRPAASPIITETLKDGRVRLRGANPTPTPTPTPTTAARKRRRPSQAGRATSGKPSRKRSPAGAKQ